MNTSADGPPVDVTELLLAWRAGDGDALGELMPLVYDQLHRVAERFVRGERPGHTLQATAVIHEAYLRMVDRTHPQWNDRLHFFAVAAKLMRRVLVDHARSRMAKKRGAGALHLQIREEDALTEGGKEPDVIDLDAALERLARFDARKASVIELRYFGGLSSAETAQVLDFSEATIRLDARLAKAWLRNQLAEGSSP